jgi:phage shock protein A
LRKTTILLRGTVIMSILKKIFTAVRGGAREAGEAIVDANGIRIFEQEIKDAENAIRKAKYSLTEVMAQEMQTKRKVTSLKDNVTQHENYTTQALDKGDESLALELAEKIAEYENDLGEQEEILSGLTGQVGALKQQIKTAEKTIKENQRQLSMVKTTESVQKATMAVQDSLVTQNSSFTSGRESLERIKKRQQMRADQMKAAQVLEDEGGDGDLKQRMEAAGIGEQKTKANDVLARLKAKKH